MLSSPLLSVVDAETIDGDDLAALDLSGDVGGGVCVRRRPAPVERRAGFPGTPRRPWSCDSTTTRRRPTTASSDGDVDWAAVPSSRYEEAVETYGDGAFAPFQAELFFGMNLSSPSLDSDALRRAIVLAIDRDGIVDAVYADLADPLPTIVPAGVVGNDPDRCPECAYDPDTAADIIDLVYPDGKVPTISIDYDESDAQQAMAELVADDLEAVGIPTTLRPLPLDEYTDFVVSGDQALFSFGWIGAYGSPDAYLAPLFGSAANDNLTNFRSRQGRRPPAPGARRTRPRGERPSLGRSRRPTSCRPAVVVPIAQFRTQVVVAERVEGLTTAVDGTIDWAQVELTG